MIDDRVTIVIPAYHSEKYIKRCLDSIYNQTYTNYHIVIKVDDWKYDNTCNIIFEHPLYHNNKIVLIDSREKTSPAIARNVAVDWAVTHTAPKYIAFCDTDDWWEPTKLYEQLQFMHDYDVDLCYTLSTWHFEDNHTEVHGIPWNTTSLKLVCVAPHSSILIDSAWAFVCKFNEQLKAADDYRWLLDLQKLGCKFGSINKPLSNMGVHSGNLTTGTGFAFVHQTCRLHYIEHEYLLMILKFCLGIGLLMKRYIWRKLKLSSSGMTA